MSLDLSNGYDDSTDEAVRYPPSHSAHLYTRIERWQIRLLRLYPGVRDDALKVDLVVADLVEIDSGVALHEEVKQVEYDAISYCWGEAPARAHLACNGIGCNITSSLEGALRRFREEADTRYLWADALCINQSDNAEKSVQVQNILTIFGKARRVLVWLGESNKFTAAAVERFWWGACDDVGTWRSKPTDEATLANELSDLCARPWCRRVWVQQEVFAAKNLMIYCGQSSFSLESYKHFAKLAPKPDGNQGVFSSYGDYHRYMKAIDGLTCAGEEALRELAHQRRERAHHLIRRGKTCYNLHGGLTEGLVRADGNHSKDIVTHLQCVLCRNDHLQATDVRDRVYALLALTDVRTSTFSPGLDDFFSRHILRIDYSRSASLVFQDTAKYLINVTGNLLPLWGHTPQEDESPNSLNLPSWCPDWRSARMHIHFSSPSRHDTDRAIQTHSAVDCLKSCIQAQNWQDVGYLRLSIKSLRPITRINPRKVQDSKYSNVYVYEHRDNAFRVEILPYIVYGAVQVGDWVTFDGVTDLLTVLRKKNREREGMPVFSFVGVGINCGTMRVLKLPPRRLVRSTWEQVYKAAPLIEVGEPEESASPDLPIFVE